MSASTVSITANQGPTTRRRAAEKNISAGGSDFAAAAVVSDGEYRDARVTAGETDAAVLRDARKHAAQTSARKSASARKSTKPRWQTVISVITKTLALLVVLLGFVQMIRWVVMNSGREGEGIMSISGDFEGKLSEVERFIKTTTKAMQVQLNAFDKKFEDGFGSVRKEFDEKIEKKGEELDLKVKALDARSDAFEKFMDGFRSKSLLSKEEFSDFFEEFQKSKKNGASDHGEVSLDEIRNFAREIVEKEIERHAADGLGMVDYALGSGGGRVVRHSEPFGGLKFGKNLGWLMSPNRVSAEAEKMIKPSFGEPGHCFALKGQSGFVEIRLRTAIVPEAVTLEHVAKSVAYDRSSAPKQCRVSGWMQGKDKADSGIDMTKMFLLTEFTYDLDKTNTQTFKVGPTVSNLVDTIRLDIASNQTFEVGPTVSNLVDTIRLDIASNHGSESHTCIYRLRVHGREPSFLPTLEMQA